MASQSSLLNHHAALEQKINAEMKRPVPDSVTIQKLKKEKLAIKEQLEHIA
jgi:hypothetical protein